MKMFSNVFLLWVLLGGYTVPCLAASPVNELPMFGEAPKTEAMLAADEELLRNTQKLGYTREQGAEKSIEAGWKYFFQGDRQTAMKRFNQAWLLDPENGNTYHGFAVLTADAGGSPQEAEKYFRLAMAKAKLNPTAYVDYAKFLNMSGRHDDAIRAAQRALAITQNVMGARIQISYALYSQKNLSEACAWAGEALKAGDFIDPPNYMQLVCNRQ